MFANAYNDHLVAVPRPAVIQECGGRGSGGPGQDASCRYLEAYQYAKPFANAYNDHLAAVPRPAIVQGCSGSGSGGPG